MQSLITFYAQQTVVLVVVAARARVEVLIMEVRLGSFEAPRSKSFRSPLRAAGERYLGGRLRKLTSANCASGLND